MDFNEFKKTIRAKQDEMKQNGIKETKGCIASTIIDGTADCISLGSLPLRASSEDVFDDKLLTDEPAETVDTVLHWIVAHISPRKSVNSRHSSYGLKHILHAHTGIYLTNNQFKNAMLMSGYMPEDQFALNWYFRIKVYSRKEF